MDPRSHAATSGPPSSLTSAARLGPLTTASRAADPPSRYTDGVSGGSRLIFPTTQDTYT